VDAAKDVFVVTDGQDEAVQTLLAGAGVRFASPEGTLAAVASFRDVVVVPGDLALLYSETIERLVQALHHEGAPMVVLVAEGQSTGIFAFRTASLLARVGDGHRSEVWNEGTQAEFIALFEAAQDLVTPVEAYDPMEVLGAKTLVEVAALDATLRARSTKRLMLGGVMICKPETCLIDADVEVGSDTVVEPYVQLLGSTKIGSDCVIRSGTVIENSTIADGVLIRQSCILTDSTVGSGAKIGPFSHLRPGSEIGEDAHIGNFVETKKARVGKGAKANHLTYLGDAVIGAGTNIGAGVITCNYDGVHKHTTTIGEGAFIGSDSTLVAPVKIGDGAYIGAGSCVTREVPADALAVARSRQVNKDGWASAKRAKLKGEC
jgi:bifunctional UDP-N-acetylglucosamine pyrophosphorylase/glucosamine-1-phosphate N-acetyltransferase